MRFYITLFLLLIAAAPLAAADANGWDKSLTLGELLERVRQANPEIEAAGSAAAAMEAKADAEFSWMAPKFSYELMAAPEGDFSLAGKRYEVSQELPFFGRAWLKSRAASKGAKVGKAMARSKIEDKLYEAKSAYWRLAADARLLAVAEELTLKLNKLSGSSDGRADFGRLDRMGQAMGHMAGAMAADMEAMVLHQRQELKNAKALLKRLAADASKKELPLPQAEPSEILTLSDPSLAKIREVIREFNPMLAAAKAERERAEASRLYARTAWLPDMMLEAGWEEDPSGMRASSLKASLSLPWVWWGMSWNDNDMAEAEADSARALLRDAEARVDEESEVMLGEWTTGRDELRLAFEKAAPRARKAMEAAVGGYASGQVELSDALDAVMVLWKIEERLAHTWWHAGDARAGLERLMAQESAKGEKP